MAPELTATPRPTAEPKPLYLPIAVKDACKGQDLYADIALVIDTSGSMSDPTTPGGPTKLVAAREAARGFLAQLSPGNDQAAVIQFNSAAAVIVPLADDPAQVMAGLDQLTQAAGTRLDLAFAAARRELTGPGRRPRNNPVLVLLTDGEPTGTTKADVLGEALATRNAGILVYTIGLGSDVDHDLLRSCATAENRYYFAPQTGDLAAIYAQVAFRLPCRPIWP